MTLGKKHDLKKLRRMLDCGKKIGMTFYGTFSVGGLGSNVEEDRKTVDLIHELSSKGLLHEIQVSINTPQPGTDFYDSCVEESHLRKDADLEGFDGNGHVVVDYPDYPADQIRRMFKEALAAFDRGKLEANKASFMKTARESFAMIPENSRILLLRSAREWMILNILDAMHTFRNIKTDILGQESMSQDLIAHPGSGHIYSYGSGFFSANGIPLRLSEKLKDSHYDYIILPVANNHLDGYKNVLEVAHLVQPKKILAVYPEGTTRLIK